MLRKLIRIVVTVLGLLFGYGIYQLTSFIFAKLEITVIDDMTPMQQSMTALGFAVFFGLIFLILTPLIRRQSVRVAENIEHDLQGVSGNDILAGVIGLITGLVIALLITQIYTAITNRYLYTAITIITYLLLGYLGVVIATIYRRWCATDGPFAELLCMMFDLKVVEPLADSRFANFFVWLNMVWLGFPGNLLLWSGSFARIPDSVIEAAKLDGVSAWREAFQIVIPCIWPTFMLLLTMQLSSIFSASGQVFLLTKGLFDTQTLSSWMYIQVYDMTQTPTANVFNMMSALGMMITAVAAVIVFTVRKFASKAFKEVQY